MREDYVYNVKLLLVEALDIPESYTSRGLSAAYSVPIADRHDALLTSLSRTFST